MFGIIFAMEEEIREIRGQLSNVRTEEHAGLSFLLGTCRGLDLVCVQCGIGKVNAAYCTGILIDRYRPEAVINTGIGGALAKDLKIGDVVVSEQALQYDMDAVGFGYALYEVPRIGTVAFDADPKLLQLAEEALPPETGCSVRRGLILTADRFVSDSALKEKLRDELGGACCEMEGAAIAQVCWLCRVPFLIVRSISDGADNNALSDTDTFNTLAARNSLHISLSVLENFRKGD